MFHFLTYFFLLLWLLMLFCHLTRKMARADFFFNSSSLEPLRLSAVLELSLYKQVIMGQIAKYPHGLRIRALGHKYIFRQKKDLFFKSQ